MLNWIVLVLGLQLLGELVATASGLPVPGPVLGMLLLLGLLLKMDRLPEQLDRLATGFLRHLYLYYLPATVGVSAHLALVKAELVPVLVAVVVSSALAMTTAGLLVQRLTAKEHDDAL